MWMGQNLTSSQRMNGIYNVAGLEVYANSLNELFLYHNGVINVKENCKENRSWKN